MAVLHGLDPMDRSAPSLVLTATEMALLGVCQISSSSAFGRIVQSLVG